MSTTEGHYRSALPFFTHYLVSDQHIFGSRFLPFVCCNDDAAALQTGFQELTERRIADRQPAAFTTQPFHAFFLRVLSAVQRNTHGKLAAHSRF